MSEKSIFHNPDIVAEILKHFDYLSESDRINVTIMLENIPELWSMDQTVRHLFISNIGKSRVHYNISLYDSAEITGNKISSRRYGYMSLEYKFSVIYPRKSLLGGDIDNELFFKIINNNKRVQAMKNIMDIFKDKECIIWSRTGISGIIEIPRRHGVRECTIVIYCHTPGVWKISMFMGGYKTIIYYKNRKIHRDCDNPAKIEFTRRGKDILTWYQNDKIHRDKGPAYREIGYRQRPIKEMWYRNGELYCEDGPRCIIYDENGKIIDAD